AGNKGIATTKYQPADEDALVMLEKMGVEFLSYDLQKGDWVEVKDRNRRKNRPKTVSEEEKKARQLVRKPKKVKPGYKKKMQEQGEQIKKRERKVKSGNNREGVEDMLRVGSHVSMSGQEMLLQASEDAASYGANTCKIYTGAPQHTR